MMPGLRFEASMVFVKGFLSSPDRIAAVVASSPRRGRRCRCLSRTDGPVSVEQRRSPWPRILPRLSLPLAEGGRVVDRVSARNRRPPPSLPFARGGAAADTFLTDTRDISERASSQGGREP